MPNPMYLKLLGVSLSEYNTYSSEKKERFQKLGQKRLAELSENPDQYDQFTTELAEPETEKPAAWEEKENI